MFKPFAILPLTFLHIQHSLTEKATMAITKSLASGFPRGVNTIYEADLSFPLPTKITDWYPKPRKTVAVKMSKIDNDIDEDDAALDDGGGDDSLTMNNNETSLVT